MYLDVVNTPQQELMLSFIFFKEEEEAEFLDGSPRPLEPIREVCQSGTDEDEENSPIRTPECDEVKDFDHAENMKLIEQRLSNMERKVSIIIPLLKKTLKAKV